MASNHSKRQLGESGAFLLGVALFLPVSMLITFTLWEALRTHRFLVEQQSRIDSEIISSSRRMERQLRSLIHSNQRLSTARNLALVGVLSPEAGAAIRSQCEAEVLLQDLILAKILMEFPDVHFPLTERPSPDEIGPGVLRFVEGEAPKISIELETNNGAIRAAAQFHFSSEGSTSTLDPSNANPLLSLEEWKVRWVPPTRGARSFPWLFKRANP